MKLPKFAEKMIVKAILSKGGPYLQKLVTAAAAAVLAYLATHVPDVEKVVTPEVLAGLLWLGIDALVTKLAAGPLKEYGKELQGLLNAKGASLNEDGFVGPVTVEAAKKIAGRNGKPGN